jgi:hypothetical protein
MLLLKTFLLLNLLNLLSRLLTSKINDSLHPGLMTIHDWTARFLASETLILFLITHAARNCQAVQLFDRSGLLSDGVQA